MTTHPHLEGLIRKLGEIAQRVEDARRNGLTEYLNGREHVELRKIATELEWMDAKSKARDAALAALPGGGVDDWQPIESAPKDEDVLVFMPGEAMPYRVAMLCYGAGRPEQWLDQKCDKLPRNPTHWQRMTSPTPNPHEADQ